MRTRPGPAYDDCTPISASSCSVTASMNASRLLCGLNRLVMKNETISTVDGGCRTNQASKADFPDQASATHRQYVDSSSAQKVAS